MRDKKIIYHDSMLPDQETSMEHMASLHRLVSSLAVGTPLIIWYFIDRFLQMKAIECGKVSLKELLGYAQSSMEIASPWNQQSDSCDCGVFCAVGCECVALGIPMMMQQDRAEFYERHQQLAILGNTCSSGPSMVAY